jgi:hypothetical protein
LHFANDLGRRFDLKKYISVLTLVLCAAFLILPGTVLAADEAAPAEPAAEEMTNQAPAMMAIEMETGNEVDILGGIKKTTIIAFMQSACRACLDEIKTIQSWMNDNPGMAKFVIVSVDMATTKARLDNYAETYKIRAKWYNDPEFKVPPMFDFNSTPGLLIIDKNKEILMSKRGWNSGHAKKFQGELTALIQ